ncbi:MAG: wax ester/triacylglycerol synthase family O-acyltransferase [Halioglobus sp.]|jgi:diacylglycerol O-acyltransferase
MIRMGGADAFMLSMETPSAYMHTFKVAIIDPSTDPEGWDFARYRKDILDRLHLIPYFRWKYAPAPLGLNHPMWVDDPAFNIDYHVRRVACPAPGDHRALCELMSSVYAYQLDRSRPLWISWVVEGLQDGKVAIVTLVHHAYVDGVGAAYGLQQLYRSEPGWHPESVPAWQPRPWPSWGKRLWWAVRDWPAVMSKNLPRVFTGVRRKKALDKRYRDLGKEAPPAAAMMQQTPINRILSPGRTFVCNQMPLDDFKAVSKGLGVTINDVFLACCAGAIRRLLQRKDYDPDQHPLISGTPFAGKRPEEMAGLGNFATVDYCWLPTHIEDPLERLQAAHKAAADMKEHLKECVESGADINSILQICPPWLMRAIRWYIEKNQGRFSLFANVVLSNVPGPKEPIYLNRYKLDSWFSTGQVFNGTCLNMTMWSYCGNANLCVLADSAVVEDGWEVYDDFVRELKRLVALTPEQEIGRQATA